MTHTSSPSQAGLHYSLLNEPLISYRHVADNARIQASLPELFVAMASDLVRDFPALRAHQRHPWHAFLCQLAAIALHAAGRKTVFETAAQWRSALLALTPDDPDGAAWCLVTPPDRPALLQAAVPGGSVASWKSVYHAADELDILVTSKNHDLKAARASAADAQDWLLALISLQTQEGFLGAGNYGISRMNGGFASRPGVGVATVEGWGRRWLRDVATLLHARDDIAQEHGMSTENGLALVWLQAWDGNSSCAFGRLDPLYIELCRRVRLQCHGAELQALGAGTKAARIAAKDLNGMTGDAWTPIDIAEGKALTITSDGFGYKLMAELLFGGKYKAGRAQHVGCEGEGTRLELIARGVTRGQGKTEGYHERRVPISPKLRRLLGGSRDVAARISGERIAAIAEVRKLLWLSLMTLFNNGPVGKDASDSTKNKASDFAKPFEAVEDARFFADLTAEVEADDASAERLSWLIALTERAERLLRHAFNAGPRSGMQRYRAQAAALSRFHGGLRSPKSPLPLLAQHYATLSTSQDNQA
ncbi:type I-E CRISPR-associated protein Cse1/CasA [Paucibacter sp. XJ19-41]|uniref:type I-E CRISPR-associated protein Cse1/CasA n=1 Tax=Paucibacter sp. XJ19-41 TaxID=2927824 RepID=UPI00234A6F91|nr:type I-E CRISPR-associated protein Cse1/CasA [Paucibacter sp. XJ19-41]MDC6166473.1 type I-E CRISPR-associated protein Cse1/CasA [Paucibacter sp. XJ19-41]